MQHVTFSKTDYAILRHGNIWSMVIFCLLGLLGFAILAGFWPPPPEYLSAPEIGAYFREHSVGIRLGMLLVITAVPFYLVWGVLLSKIMERLGDGGHLLGRIELAGAATASIILALPCVIWLVAAFRPEIRSDAEIQLLYDLAWLMFDLPLLFFGAQYISAGIAILLDKRTKPLFPAWLAWLGFFDTFTFFAVLLAPFVYDGPFAWHGLISFWVVFVTFFVYLLAFMLLIPGALKRLAAEDQQAGTT
ncbi:hypothetical protein NCG89_13820 [Spongiibacter taiwanensis]|uniref:hypothetical protein n=1 Tax=Spongiibacter taiwanensis TaxID=1748242 RepID=UPI0020361E1A|nr:hypothetical protein [Spongiibacter taiwanensis]USA42607.1 hypothetical protein NCG89_13820 [Spongiibacter taiwanensis]